MPLHQPLFVGMIGPPFGFLTGVAPGGGCQAPAVADHDRFREAQRLVTRPEYPSDLRGSAEHGKIVRTHLQYFEMLRTISAGHI